MAELQADLVKIVVEKGLLGLVLAGLAFYVQRALERLRARNVYWQKLAEEKLAALKQISLIYSQQLMLLGHFARILEGAPAPTPEAKEKFVQDLSSAYRAFAEHYRDQGPGLFSAASLFASRDLADRLIAHHGQVGRLVEILQHPESYAQNPAAGPPLSLIDSLSDLQQALANELRIPPDEGDAAAQSMR